MTHREAKSLLEVYRASGADAGDPRFGEALERLKTDPELARWFGQEQAFDAAISRHVKAGPVPAGLKAAILAGEKVLAHLAWWRLVNWRRMAALALVLWTAAGLFVFSLQKTRNLLAASREAIRMAEERSTSRPGVKTDLEELRSWLARCRVPPDFEVPLRLRRLPLVDYNLVPVRDRTAAVLCFRLAGKTQLKLFVMDQIQDAALLPDGTLRTMEDGDWGAAIWSDKGKTYVLAGRFPPQSLRRLLI
jgi:hypothetical protein